MTEIGDLNEALSAIVKAAWCENQLARGINESCRAIESWYDEDENQKSALCILADDVGEDEYKKLIVALCNTEKVQLVTTESKSDIGTWAGFASYDEEGEVTKTRDCGVVVIKKYPAGEEGNINIVQQHQAANKDE